MVSDRFWHELIVLVVQSTHVSLIARDEKSSEMVQEVFLYDAFSR